MLLDEGMVLGLEVPPLSLPAFFSNREGVWLEAGRSSVYQASAGGDVSGNGNPVGFWQDLSKTGGLNVDDWFETQPELISNGEDWDGLTGTPSTTPPDGWTVAVSSYLFSSPSAGQLRIDRNSGSFANRPKVSISTVVGEWYCLEIGVIDPDVTNIVANDYITIDFPGAEITTSTSGPFTAKGFFKAVTSTPQIAIRPSASAAQVIDLSHFRVRHLPGRHFLTAVTAERPTYTTGAPAKLTHDASDDTLGRDFTGESGTYNAIMAFDRKSSRSPATIPTPI